MAVKFRHPGLLAWAVVALLAGCSAGQKAPASPVHANAAQRIDLGPAGAVPPGTAARDLAATRNESVVVEEIHLPDGTVGVKVAKQYFHTIVACRQPDGTYSTNCPAASEARP